LEPEPLLVVVAASASAAAEYPLVWDRPSAVASVAASVQAVVFVLAAGSACCTARSSALEAAWALTSVELSRLRWAAGGESG
jgi:hypothetical protein